MKLWATFNLGNDYRLSLIRLCFSSLPNDMLSIRLPFWAWKFFIWITTTSHVSFLEHKCTIFWISPPCVYYQLDTQRRDLSWISKWKDQVDTQHRDLSWISKWKDQVCASSSKLTKKIEEKNERRENGEKERKMNGKKISRKQRSNSKIKKYWKLCKF